LEIISGQLSSNVIPHEEIVMTDIDNIADVIQFGGCVVMGIGVTP